VKLDNDAYKIQIHYFSGKISQYNTVDSVKEIVKRVNEYEELEKENENMKNKYLELMRRKDNQKETISDLQAKNRELETLLKMANDFIKQELCEGCLTGEIDEVLEKSEGVE